jgi:hypothetical protein
VKKFVGRDTLLGIVWEAGTRCSFDASVLSGGCMVILGADLHVYIASWAVSKHNYFGSVQVVSGFSTVTNGSY